MARISRSTNVGALVRLEEDGTITLAEGTNTPEVITLLVHKISYMKKRIEFAQNLIEEGSITGANTVLWDIIDYVDSSTKKEVLGFNEVPSDLIAFMKKMEFDLPKEDPSLHELIEEVGYRGKCFPSYITFGQDICGKAAELARVCFLISKVWSKKRITK